MAKPDRNTLELGLAFGDTPTKRAVISEDEAYRYSLERVWNPALPLCFWCCLNPSTADALHDDPSLTRMISFSRGFGCGGLVLVNLFAYRSTSPTRLKKAYDEHVVARKMNGFTPEEADRDASLHIIGPDNLVHQVGALCRAADKGGLFVCGWGAQPILKRIPGIVDDFLIRADSHGVKLMALGFTDTPPVQPRHPLYFSGGLKAPVTLESGYAS